MSPRRKTEKTGENTKDSSKKPNVPKPKEHSSHEGNVDGYVDIPFPHNIKAPKSTKINPER